MSIETPSTETTTTPPVVEPPKLPEPPKTETKTETKNDGPDWNALGQKIDGFPEAVANVLAEKYPHLATPPKTEPTKTETKTETKNEPTTVQTQRKRTFAERWFGA